METDKERFLELMQDFGIAQTYDYSEGDVIVIVYEAKSQDRVIGYFGFSMNWFFDENGKFVQVGIWE